MKLVKTTTPAIFKYTSFGKYIIAAVSGLRDSRFSAKQAREQAEYVRTRHA